MPGITTSGRGSDRKPWRSATSAGQEAKREEEEENEVWNEQVIPGRDERRPRNGTGAMANPAIEQNSKL